jgi:hypothetical protein
MTGELILTSYTYDQGRTAINYSYSALADFNAVIITEGLSACTSGVGAIMSAGTDLYNIFATTAGSDLTTASNGLTLGGYNVTLGGDLTGSTTVVNPGYTYYISSSSTASGGNTIYQKGFIGSSYYEIKTTPIIGVEMIGSDGANITNTVTTTVGGAYLEYNSAGTAVQVNVEAGGVEISDTVGNVGAFYASNYHSNYTIRSLPDVEWVNIQIGTATTANVWTSSTGTNSIVANNGTNLASGEFTIVGGDSNSATTSSSTVINGYINLSSGIYSFIGNGSGNIADGTYASTIGGLNNRASGIHSSIVGGAVNLASGSYSFISNGINNTASTIYASVLGGTYNKIDADYSVIIGGTGNIIPSSATSAVVLGMTSFVDAAIDTTHMANAYIQGYADLEPQATFPKAKAGRMFYSAGTLNRLILFTGNTLSDWMVLN